MIPVAPANEPATFDAQVRQPGKNAINQLTGKTPQKRGRPRTKAGAYAHPRQIRAKEFTPYWRAALDDLGNAYQNYCAYLGVYLQPGTSARSVDHFIPKSKNWKLVYEWKNYRFAAAQVNTNRKEIRLPLDPFKIPPNLFALELGELQVVPGPAANTDRLRQKVDATINILGLNDTCFLKLRQDYFTSYLEGEITLTHLEKKAPFVYTEVIRQTPPALTPQNTTP